MSIDKHGDIESLDTMSSPVETTRDRILDAAWRLLEARAPSRMADIAKAAGVSRQALYLHFANRAELLVATTHWIDQAKDVDARLAASRSAASGEARLDAFIDAWGGYIPEIYGVARALMAMSDADEAAAAAWRDRMCAVRGGCRAAVDALARDGRLVAGLAPETATDLLWTLLSVRAWEQLTQDCNWPQERYLSEIKRAARAALVGAA